MLLVNKKLHGDIVFQTYNREGQATHWKGGYVIVDGGYPKMAMFMDPSIELYDYNSVMWAEWLESIRKDVECVFGFIKNRFRLLRNRVVYHDYRIIHNAVKVAAILHNRLLEYNGYNEFDWEACDPDGDEPLEGITIVVQNESMVDSGKQEECVGKQP
jgi:hypothetical protein